MRLPLFAAITSAAALLAFGAQAAGDTTAGNPNASVYDNAGWTFAQFDKDGDGTLSRAEVYGTLFGIADVDADQQLSSAEFETFIEETTLPPTGWDVDNDGEITQADFQRIQNDPTGAEDARQGVPGQTARTPEDAADETTD